MLHKTRVTRSVGSVFLVSGLIPTMPTSDHGTTSRQKRSPIPPPPPRTLMSKGARSAAYYKPPRCVAAVISRFFCLVDHSEVIIYLIHLSLRPCDSMPNGGEGTRTGGERIPGSMRGDYFPRCPPPPPSFCQCWSTSWVHRLAVAGVRYAAPLARFWGATWLY